MLLAGCAGGRSGGVFGTETPPAQPEPSQAIGQGKVSAALILPLSASGNAGMAAQSMRNAAELALAEFDNPDIRLMVKDDGGTAAGAQAATRQALDEGAEIILGPLFGHSVGQAGRVARERGVPMIAFSTDASVASRGVYLLSFLPETDVERIVQHAVSSGKRSFAAMIPDNAYGSVAEAAFTTAVARRGGRIAALQRYSQGNLAGPARSIAQSARAADAIFIPDGADQVPAVVQALAQAGVKPGSVQLLGTGLWDDPRIQGDPGLQGAWYAAPEPAGFSNFSARYRARFNSDPVRTATLAYDAAALVAALVRTQGPQRFSEPVLTNRSGFAGIDGVFRFRSNGLNERGLAVMQVASGGARVVSPAPRNFDGSGT